MFYLFVCPYQVICVGQIIGAIVAENREQAKRAADQVAITYQDIQPVFFTIEVFVNVITFNKHYTIRKEKHTMKVQ